MTRGLANHIQVIPALRSQHTLITELCRRIEGLAIKGLPIMRGKRTNRETLDKSQIPLTRLAEPYFITCHTEGKTASTLRGYQEKPGRSIYWSDGASLGDFSLALVREYISYPQPAPKYEGHPFHESNGQNISAANLQNHVRVLRAFSSWLQREGFTQDIILG